MWNLCENFFIEPMIEQQSTFYEAWSPLRSGSGHRRDNMIFGGMRTQQKTLHFDNSSMQRIAVGATHTSETFFEVAALQKLVD
jgi:hypothetical protein